MPRSNSFSSASEFSVTPSQKARELRKQLDQALQTSVAIRNTQEKLNTEISTFKSRLQWQSHLSPRSVSPNPRQLSPRRSNSASGIPLSSTEAYVSLTDLQVQRTEEVRTFRSANDTLSAEQTQISEPSGTLDSFLAEREMAQSEAHDTEGALQSFKEENAHGSEKESVEYNEEEEDLYLSPSAQTDSEEFDIRSQQVDSILNGLAQASPRSAKTAF